MADGSPTFLLPDWPAPAHVQARVTTRYGGVSQSPYDSFNLARHVGDDPHQVEHNRQTLQAVLQLPTPPRWLSQVHGDQVVDATQAAVDTQADASFTVDTGTVCAVLTADCLPVLFSDLQGRGVAVAHAGWRGLAAGVLQATATALATQLACPASQLMAWMGPAIGPDAFEVGDEVREVFVRKQPPLATAFVPSREGHWYADMYALARMSLQAYGMDAVYGGGLCTYSDAAQFYSYRRQPTTGRMATLIWMTNRC